MLGEDTTSKIYIAAKTMQKINLYVKESQGEISGIGCVVPLDKGLLIKDVFLFKQETGPGDTELDNETMLDFLYEINMRDADPAELKCWWHSHPDKVYWSGIDNSNIERFKDVGYLVSLVTNKKREVLVRLDMFKPIRATFDQLPLVILEAKDEVLEAEIKAEFAEKVTYRTYVYKPYVHKPYKRRGKAPLRGTRDFDRGDEDDYAY